MDIEDAREKQKVMEKEIAGIIQYFEKSTNTRVRDLSINRSTTMGAYGKVSYVRADVSLSKDMDIY